MQRGDIVTVALQGDFGKSHPAVVVQNNEMTGLLDTVILCPVTSTENDAPFFRVRVTPARENGLIVTSYVMADKVMATRRTRVGPQIGRLGGADMTRLDAVLAFALGIAI